MWETVETSEKQSLCASQILRLMSPGQIVAFLKRVKKNILFFYDYIRD